MFDKKGQWVHLETYDDFDNGLSELIDLWISDSTVTTTAIKESALQNFKVDLEAAVLKWEDNKAKSKKYAAIGMELEEFEAVIKEGEVAIATATASAKASPAPAKTKKKV